MHLTLLLANTLALITLAQANYCEGNGDDNKDCYCNASFSITCNSGRVETPLEPNSGQCNTNACINEGGIKKIEGNTDGHFCERLVVYGSTDCSTPTYTSSTDQCDRHEGLTSGTAQWYSYIAYCGGGI